MAFHSLCIDSSSKRQHSVRACVSGELYFFAASRFCVSAGVRTTLASGAQPMSKRITRGTGRTSDTFFQFTISQIALTYEGRTFCGERR
jgi:hypothetical protein